MSITSLCSHCVASTWWTKSLKAVDPGYRLRAGSCSAVSRATASTLGRA